MSHTVLRALAIAACLASLPATALAESIERDSYDRIKTVKPKGLTAIFGDSTDDGSPAINEIPAQQTQSEVGGRTINITQPQVPDAVPQAEPAPQQIFTRQAEPAPAPVEQAAPNPRSQSASRGSSGGSEADWWNETGNPAVFTFRDCLSSYSRAQAQAHPKLNLKTVLADAMKGDCKPQFDAVSTALAERFGAKRGQQMAQELGGSTFVPAVREAVLNVRQEQKQAAAARSRTPAVASAASPEPKAQQPVPQPASTDVAAAAAAGTTAPAGAPQPVGPQLDLAIAKEEMFTCYRSRTDRGGPQEGKPVDAVVDQVLLECSDHTRAFFKRLFDLYPHPSAQQAEKMREAIATSYRPAIASRVQALRTAAVQGTAPAASGSSTVVKSTSASQ